MEKIKTKQNRLGRAITGTLAVGIVAGTLLFDSYFQKAMASINLDKKPGIESVVYKIDEDTDENFNSSKYSIDEKVDKDISHYGLNYIKKFEGFKEKAYLCPAKKWTIGYGTTKKVRKGDRTTEKKAEKVLIKDVDYFESCLEKYVKVPLNQNQYDALVSFVYNVGEGNFEKSTLLRKLNNSDYTGASKEFDKWVYANGKKLKGLINRRQKEKSLFLKSY